VWPPRLLDRPGLALGVEAYGGNAVLVTSDDNRAHVHGGGQLRIRYSHFLLGGAAEISEINTERWRSLGGFVGAWLPCYRWVDFEATAGIAIRRLQNADERYGQGGYDVTTPALTLRFGLSDPTSERRLRGRIGFALTAAIDLSRPHVAWQYPLHPGPEALVTRGSVEPGGLTIGFVLTVGLEAQLTDAKVVRPPTDVARREDGAPNEDAREFR
jgi:hypothetical protein